MVRKIWRTTYMCVFVYDYLEICVQLCVYICMCIHMSLYVYMWYI